MMMGKAKKKKKIKWRFLDIGERLEMHRWLGQV